MGRFLGTMISIRPLNAVMAVMAVITGSIVEIGPAVSDNVFTVVLLSISAFLLVGGANIYNDINDRKIDRKVHPERRIASGALSLADARTSLVVLLASSILAGAIVSLLVYDPFPVILLVSAFIMVIFYETILKKRGIWGNIGIGVLTGSIFIFGGTPWTPGLELIILGLLACLSTISREIVKDIQDMHGEREERLTLPMSIGRGKAQFTALTIMLLAVLISFIPLFHFGSGPVYLFFISTADIVMLTGIIASFKKPYAGQILIKFGMFTAVTGFLLSSII